MECRLQLPSSVTTSKTLLVHLFADGKYPLITTSMKQFCKKLMLIFTEMFTMFSSLCVKFTDFAMIPHLTYHSSVCKKYNNCFMTIMITQVNLC